MLNHTNKKRRQCESQGPSRLLGVGRRTQQAGSLQKSASSKRPVGSSRHSRQVLKGHPSEAHRGRLSLCTKA